MKGDCASLLRAGRHRAAGVLRHTHRPSGHAGVHARGMAAAHPPAAGCRDTDAPYRALHSSGPASGAQGRGLGGASPASFGPAPGAAGGNLASTAAKAAGLLAASSAAGAAAGSGYRAFTGAQTGLQPQGEIEALGSPAFGLTLAPPLLAVPALFTRHLFAGLLSGHRVRQRRGAAERADPPRRPALRRADAARHGTQDVAAAATRHQLTTLTGSPVTRPR